jgi:hypothetical protein
VSGKPDDKPDAGDLELAVHVANGLFVMIEWIDDGSIDFSGVDKHQVRNVRHELAIAGRMLTRDIINRL